MQDHDFPIVFIYPYYENPGMLERQVENWNSYGRTGKNLHIILVDDGSPDNPALPIFENVKHKKNLFRIKENIPWGQHHARNVGAKEAGRLSGKQSWNPWLFMSDIDIMVTPEAFYEICETEFDPRRYHTFERNFVGNVRDPKYHCNTFMVKHKNFWSINGYDCDYCGAYGGDGEFLRQLDRVAPHLHHGYPSKHIKQYVECNEKPITLWGYESDIVPDANTTEWPRKKSEFHNRYREVFDEKRLRGDMRSKNPIRWEYERLI